MAENRGLNGRSCAREGSDKGAPSFFFKKDFDTDAATIGPMLFDVVVVDVWVHCTEANGSGTMTLSDGTNDITDAVACATNHAVDRAATIDDAQRKLLKGESFTLTPANNAKGTAFILCCRA